jgi:predicted amidohydrolase
VGEMLNIDYANVEGCAKAVAENPDRILGVKARITDNVVGQNGLEPLRRALKAASLAGPSFRGMCHIGSAPGSLSDLLDLLRPGIFTTVFLSADPQGVIWRIWLHPPCAGSRKEPSLPCSTSDHRPRVFNTSATGC